MGDFSFCQDFTFKEKRKKKKKMGKSQDRIGNIQTSDNAGGFSNNFNNTKKNYLTRKFQISIKRACNKNYLLVPIIFQISIVSQNLIQLSDDITKFLRQPKTKATVLDGGIRFDLVRMMHTFLLSIIEENLFFIKMVYFKSFESRIIYLPDFNSPVGNAPILHISKCFYLKIIYFNLCN